METDAQGLSGSPRGGCRGVLHRKGGRQQEKEMEVGTLRPDRGHRDAEKGSVGQIEREVKVRGRRL